MFFHVPRSKTITEELLKAKASGEKPEIFRVRMKLNISGSGFIKYVDSVSLSIDILTSRGEWERIDTICVGQVIGGEISNCALEHEKEYDITEYLIDPISSFGVNVLRFSVTKRQILQSNVTVNVGGMISVTYGW